MSFYFIIDLFSRSFSAVVGWFNDIFVSTGANSIFLAVVFIVLLVRYLLTPIFGQRGSDTSSRKFNKSSSVGDDDG